MGHSQLNVCAVTGHSIGEKSTAARYRFQIRDIKLKGRDQRPRENRACLNSCGVMNVRPTVTMSVGFQCAREREYLQQIRAYAVIVGTPAALTSDVKATGDGKIVQSNNAATHSMTVMAFFGLRFLSTAAIQPENGNTPSLATAQISRELATPAMVVLKIRPKMQIITMKTCPPCPKAMA